MQEIKLSELRDGGLQEQFNASLETVLKNILDPNTSHKVARKITIDLTFKTPSDERTEVQVDMSVREKLAASTGIVTNLAIRSKGTTVEAAEWRQQNIFDDTKVQLKEVK